MNMGKTIADLDVAHSVPGKSLYIAKMGDGTGTKAVPHEDVVEAVAASLSLGDMSELETEEKGSFVDALNEIVEKLAVVGIRYRGKYASGTAYKNLDAVYSEQDGSSYVALKDNPVGAPNADGVNWQYLAKGFLDGLLVAKTQIVNNLLATVPGNVLDAMQGKKLSDMISTINSNMAKKADKTSLPATSYTNATVNSAIATDASAQSQRYGNICCVYFIGHVTAPNAWTDYKLCSGLPRAKFGFTPFGILQTQTEQRSVLIWTNQNGDLYMRSENHGWDDWMRGQIIYVCQ